MDDLRKKVIREIEKVLEMADQNDGFMIPVFESIQAFEDALSLLKAQEPRVMTLEEVKDANWDYCYLEYDAVRGKEEQIFMGGRHRIACVTWPTTTAMRISPGDNEYEKRWRCWTQRPTDEQRKATAWKPLKEE